MSSFTSAAAVACALGPLLFTACGSTSEPALVVNGRWESTPTGVSYTASGTTRQTSMTLTMVQKGDSITFSKWTEGNGVVWTCPNGTLSGKAITVPACDLTNQFAACKSSATVTGTVDDSTNPYTLTLGAYSCSWTGGSSCPIDGTSVSVAPITLTRL